MYAREVAFAHHLADVAAEIGLGRFRRTGLEVKAKADRTLVTDADLAIEAAIRREIGATFPEDRILGEEEGGSHEPSGRVWVIDPIDGTANYARGIPIWGVLVALRIDGRSVVGVADAPALGERYAAAVDGPATLNGEAIHVSEVAAIEDAHVLYAQLGDVLRGPLHDGVEGLIRDAWRDRGFGDFWAHMLVAGGGADVMLEPELNLWDFAALEPIVAAAGGRMTTFEGDPPAHKGSVVTTNGHLHDEVLRRLAAR
ncbi:MAG TPA: inositol monophosphatase family protein [Actinomycetota bacterium]